MTQTAEYKFLERLRNEQYPDDVLREALGARGRAQDLLMALAQERKLKFFPENRAQVRSVIEVSNVCRQKCNYCAIGGKDQSLNIGELATAVGRIKAEHAGLRIILCCGNLSREQYRQLRAAGATDYILKFEASNPELFARCKPNDTLENRLHCIGLLHEEGFRVGSGNIVGLPGQTIDDLVSDLQLAHRLPLSMNSTTIFVPAENTPFANEPAGDPHLTLNMMALLRIMNPQRLMPTTSSLEPSPVRSA